MFHYENYLYLAYQDIQLLLILARYVHKRMAPSHHALDSRRLSSAVSQLTYSSTVPKKVAQLCKCHSL